MVITTEQVYTDKTIKLFGIRKTEWAYLAGMIDGDGSIMLTIQNHSGSTLHHYYVPTIKIVGTDKVAIQSIAVDFAGSYYIDLNKGYGKDGSKRLHSVSWRAQLMVKTILENILPYLRIKKAQAELLLDYCNLRLNRISHKAGMGINEERIRILIKEANRR